MAFFDERRILDVVLRLEVTLKAVMNPLCNLLDSDIGHLCVLTNVLTPNVSQPLLDLYSVLLMKCPGLRIVFAFRHSQPAQCSEKPLLGLRQFALENKRRLDAAGDLLYRDGLLRQTDRVHTSAFESQSAAWSGSR